MPGGSSGAMGIMAFMGDQDLFVIIRGFNAVAGIFSVFELDEMN